MLVEEQRALTQYPGGLEARTYWQWVLLDRSLHLQIGGYFI